MAVSSQLAIASLWVGELSELQHRHFECTLEFQTQIKSLPF